MAMKERNFTGSKGVRGFQKPRIHINYSSFLFLLLFVARHPRGIDWQFFIMLIRFIGSRHLVFNWGLLGNPDVLVFLEIHG
jgi:hypothetical protein